MTRSRLWVSLLAAMASGIAGAAPPSPWKQTVPPFVTLNGIFARPLLVTTPASANAKRMAELEVIASYAAMNYKRVGFAAPRLKVMEPSLLGRLAGANEESAYVLAYSRDGYSSAAAAYTGGVVVDATGRMGTLKEIGGNALTTLVRSQTDAVTGGIDGWDGHIWLGESSMFEDKDLKVFPQRANITLAHELFHSIQASYPQFSRHEGSTAHQGKWITEGLADAIAPWALSGLRSQGSVPFQWTKALASGSERFGKVLGLRPYDYPLDLSAVPLSGMKIKPELREQDKIVQLASYMTNAFWRYVFEEKPSAGKEWRALPGRLAYQASGSDRRADALDWASEAVKAAIPTFTDGLFRAFPAFIADRVEYPDEVMKSRKGVFAHPAWLEYMFQDGCPVVTLTEQMVKPAEETLTIRPLAAKCLRLRWQGARFPVSGAPTATLSAVPVALPLVPKDEALSMESLHIGHHSTSEGFFMSYKDRATGGKVKLGHPLDLDPLPSSQTNGEVVVTFSNVARDPKKTVIQQYKFTIVVSSAKVEGSVTQPGDPEASRPASTGKAKGKRQTVPALKSAGGGDGIVVGGTDASTAVDEMFDCMNGISKQTSAGGLIQIDTAAPKAAPEGPPKSCMVLTQLASPAFMAQHKGKMGVNLHLPPIATGTKGAVKGGVVSVGWYDPAMRPDHDANIGAETELVNVNIAEATETYIRGGFSARFTKDLHDMVGTVSGDFLQARADTESPEFPENPLDMFSSDALLAFHYAGVDAKQLQQMAGKAAEEARRERAAPSAARAAGGQVLGAGEAACTCDCKEFFGPKRQTCSKDCSTYPNAMMCTIEREQLAGSSDGLDARIKACPDDCASLANATGFCADLHWSKKTLCAAKPLAAAGGVAAELRCVAAYLGRELDAEQRQLYIDPLIAQIRAMKPDEQQIMLAPYREQIAEAQFVCP